jgi:hypothetical protein
MLYEVLYICCAIHLRMKLFWNYKFIFLLFTLYYVFQFSTKDAGFNYTIDSDGEGYYAYLPAVYLLKDNTYQKSKEVKRKQTKFEVDYVISTEDGKHINKFFSGVSLIATPAFFVITGYLELTGEVPDGYNIEYSIGMFFYSILLFVLGFLLYTTTISRHYQLNKKQQWVFLVVLLATTWLFSAIYTVMYANNYLFVCFSFALWLLLKIKEQPERRIFSYLFFLLIGLVAVVRPTSLIFLVMMLYFFDDFQSFTQFFKTYILKWKVMLIGVALLLLPIAYQFFIWKWQTGAFFVWSYSGEGFNWFHPQLLEVIFSYRTGILFHSPILILVLVYVLFCFRRNPYKSVIYLVYFFLICYVSASWWCFDFETKHGLRNFNEHYVFLLLPLFDLIKEVQQKKWLLIPLLIATILPFIRFNQFVFEYNINQRYTMESYWKSLLFWKPENKQRWIYYRSAQPYGKRNFYRKIIDNQNISFNGDEFFLSNSLPFEVKSGERYYIKISLDRKTKGDNNKPVLFIVDYVNQADEKIRSYAAVPIYEDKLKEEEHVEIYQYHFDYQGKRDKLGLYFWNLEKVSGEFNNVTVELERYVPYD